MADILIFDPDSVPPKLVTQYLESEPAKNYTSRFDVIIYPDGKPDDIDSLQAAEVPMSLWIVDADGTTVREMNQGELDAKAAQDAIDDAASEAGALAALKQQALDFYQRDQEALEKALKAAIETVVELTVDQLNVLRSLHSLNDITNAQVKNAFNVAYSAKINAIT